MNVQAWLSAFRLRTLPLAVSGILCGSWVAEKWQNWNLDVLIWATLTAILLQILSNLANDYGDFVKGTDNDNRIGNMRALQSGVISVGAMRNMILFFILLCFISGIRLLWVAFDGVIDFALIAYFIVGVLAILAAVYYTIGKQAYGYSGKGDIAVFMFFGPVSVAGVFLLHTRLFIHAETIIPLVLSSIGIGLLSTAVLNTNNIRDIENDRNSGKFTLPVKWGVQKAKQYHLLLVGLAVLSMSVVAFISFHWLGFITLLTSAIAINQAVTVKKLLPSPAYNNLLKQLSLGTLFIAMSLWFCSAIESFFIWKGLIE
jgi:1,4-dihydroxy-2-naphthoate octaprenyltransferase